MAQQAAVQSANSLPIFDAELVTIERDGDLPYPQLTISNVGGMARYSTLTLDTIATVFVQDEEDRRMSVSAGKIIYRDYFSETDVVDRSALWQQDWVFSSPEHAQVFRDVEQQANSKHRELNDDRRLSFRITHYVTITYTDYQGIFRTEHYIIDERRLTSTYSGVTHHIQAVESVDEERWQRIQYEIDNVRSAEQTLHAGNASNIEEQVAQLVQIVESWKTSD